MAFEIGKEYSDDDLFGATPELFEAGKEYSDDDLGLSLEAKPEQDNAALRGLHHAKSGLGFAADMTTGDYSAAAQNIADLVQYNQANPGSKEGNKLMAAFESGDGISGGVKNVLGVMGRNISEAPTAWEKAKASGRDIAAMGGGIVEQVPNMAAPMAGMLAGGLAGGAAGSAVPIVGNVAGAGLGAWAGASAGNTLVEGQGIAMDAIQKAGIDPLDRVAVAEYLDKNASSLFGKAATKGTIIGLVDTITAGASQALLKAPLKAATGRVLADMGVDVANKGAVDAAMKLPEFGSRLASDAAYQASKAGAGNIARNVGAAATEPVSEGLGEYAGTGIATGDWDEKNAFLEGVSSIGQGGMMYAGQKAYQKLTTPKDAPSQTDTPPVPDGPTQQTEQDLTAQAQARFDERPITSIGQPPPPSGPIGRAVEAGEQSGAVGGGVQATVQPGPAGPTDSGIGADPWKIYDEDQSRLLEEMAFAEGRKNAFTELQNADSLQRNTTGRPSTAEEAAQVLAGMPVSPEEQIANEIDARKAPSTDVERQAGLETTFNRVQPWMTQEEVNKRAAWIAHDSLPREGEAIVPGYKPSQLEDLKAGVETRTTKEKIKDESDRSVNPEWIKQKAINEYFANRETKVAPFDIGAEEVRATMARVKAGQGLTDNQKVVYDFLVKAGSKLPQHAAEVAYNRLEHKYDGLTDKHEVNIEALSEGDKIVRVDDSTGVPVEYTKKIVDGQVVLEDHVNLYPESFDSINNVIASKIAPRPEVKERTDADVAEESKAEAEAEAVRRKELKDEIKWVEDEVRRNDREEVARTAYQAYEPTDVPGAESSKPFDSTHAATVSKMAGSGVQEGMVSSDTEPALSRDASRQEEIARVERKIKEAKESGLIPYVVIKRQLPGGRKRREAYLVDDGKLTATDFTSVGQGSISAKLGRRKGRYYDVVNATYEFSPTEQFSMGALLNKIGDYAVEVYDDKEQRREKTESEAAIGITKESKEKDRALKLAEEVESARVKRVAKGEELGLKKGVTWNKPTLNVQGKGLTTYDYGKILEYDSSVGVARIEVYKRGMKSPISFTVEAFSRAFDTYEKPVKPVFGEPQSTKKQEPPTPIVSKEDEAHVGGTFLGDSKKNEELQRKSLSDAKQAKDHKFAFKAGDRVVVTTGRGTEAAIVLSGYIENGEERYTLYPPGKKSSVGSHYWSGVDGIAIATNKKRTQAETDPGEASAAPLEVDNQDELKSASGKQGVNDDVENKKTTINTDDSIESTEAKSPTHPYTVEELQGVMITEYTNADTGQRGTLSEGIPAVDALTANNDEIDMYQRLLNCVKGA